MKNYLKYASWIIIALTIAYVCATFKDCGEAGETSGLVVIPADSGYLPVTVRQYRPKSTPFENPVKPVSKLPKGVKESDVTRVIIIRRIPVMDTLVIIETKQGDVLVEKNDSIEVSVTVTTYLPPVMEFGLFCDLGLNISPPSGEIKRGLFFSPAASVSFIKWYGVLNAPEFTADLSSVGIGCSYKVYHDVYVGPLLTWNYGDLQKSIKLKVSIEL